MTRARLVPLVTAGVVCAVLWGTSMPADAYLKLGTRVGDRTITLQWRTATIEYFVNDEGGAGLSAEQFRQVLERAFRTWENVETATVTFRYAGFTSARPLQQDDRNTIGFLNRPDLDRVLASTNFLIDTRNGNILESDIFFNANFPWSVAEAGIAGRHDVESIALHEIGHFVGLGHSAIGETELRPGGGRRVIAAESAMFPIAFAPGNVVGRRLTPDDIAGVSDIYPTGDFRRRTGSIQGRVTRGGRGLFGAHVVAYDQRTGDLVGNFSLDEQGEFAIAGLRPGPYVVRVEPLDDGDIESFFDRAANVDIDFRAAFYERLVVVPRGGGTRRLEITVQRR
jgi:hypothetical protein